MSDQYNDDGDLYDPYATRGPSGPPVVSWKRADVGDAFTGIVLPSDPFTKDQGYSLKQSYGAVPWDKEDRGYLFWPPKEAAFTRPDGQRYRGPVTRTAWEKFAQREGLETGGLRKKSEAHIVFLTEYRKNEFCSGPVRDQRKEEDVTDDGLRRVIDDHQDMSPKIKDALQALRSRGPQPGQIWTIKLAKRVPNEHGGESNTFMVDILPATPDSMAKVTAWCEAAVKAKETADLASSDPYATAPAGRSEEPPF